MASPDALLIAQTAKTWGRSPSDYLEVVDPVLRYAVDEAIAMRFAIAQAEARKVKGKGALPVGQRYETPGEILASVKVN